MADQPAHAGRHVNPSLHLGVGTELVEHASRIGITLRSAGRLRQTPAASARSARTHTPGGYPITKDRLPLSAWDRPHTAILTQPQYIHNVVVPLTLSQDDENLSKSVNHKTLRGNKNVPYNSRGPGNLSARSARSTGSASTYLSRYMTTTPIEDTTYERHKKSEPGVRRSGPLSDQALRYQHEQDVREEGLRRKRVAQIQPHRLDRMYYMCGLRLGMGGRYEVDTGELQRLQDMTRVRKQATHYGRGLSMEKRKLLQNAGLEEHLVEDATHGTGLQRQPPQSQLHGRLTSTGPTPVPELDLTVAGHGKQSTKTVSQDAAAGNDVTRQDKDTDRLQSEPVKAPQNTSRTDLHEPAQTEAQPSQSGNALETSPAAQQTTAENGAETSADDVTKSAPKPASPVEVVKLPREDVKSETETDVGLDAKSEGANAEETGENET